MIDFPKKYDFSSAEAKWRKFWEESRLYESRVNPGKKKYSIVMPPPNVTGILHFGHMLNNTIQDIYSRWKRMQDFEVCWVPGMDHAGIATQVMVEKELAKEGKTKYDLGREKFIDLVWKWKEKNGGFILSQLRKLGASVDWSKERFTMDEGFSLAVKTVFVDLFKKGLVYRGTRIVNWDPVSQTAVSDDEVYYEEKADKLYYIKYSLKNSDDFITIATTRPETICGDTAMAGNPEDKRYYSVIGKEVILPFINKIIPVIADKYVDPKFGTGALKITPAHDLNDYEVGERHGLEKVVVLTKQSILNENAGEFAGMDILSARQKIESRLKDENLLVKVEDYLHNVAFSDRTKAMIEPYLSEQWFVKMKVLAEPALEAVKSEKIKFYPERYTKVYYHWMENIRDWCISRQLWWGHQIPIWYHKETGEIYCDINPPSDIESWEQDPDVLDTWFSSWLWPFAVFGWKNSEEDKKNQELQYYYPTDFLSTGPEIIFLWVARMIMSGLEYMKGIPFKEVYFHSTVRDISGKKMSKTLGNYSDAIELMDKYGTDALRFSIVYLAPLGNDILFEESKTEIGRNFITKLWNAGRFLHMNTVQTGEDASLSENPAFIPVESDLIDKWIMSRFNTTIKNANKYLSEYRLNEYTKTIYQFVWSDFCDWYIELLKTKLRDDKSAIGNAIFYYENILKLLHPVIPYVTEDLWHIFDPGREDRSISFELLPEYEEKKINQDVENSFESVKEIIIGIRNLRAVNQIPPSGKSIVYIKPLDEKCKSIIEEFHQYILKLCNLDNLELTEEKKEGNEFAPVVLNRFEIYLKLEGAVDLEKHTEKINKEIENLQKYISSLEKKLENEGFTSKAPKELVEKEKRKYDESKEKLERLKEMAAA
jgi:valyl-tRNA synthetase